MIVRIVKMSFESNKVSEFLENFNAHKLDIRNFPGCQLLELYQDKKEMHIFFTYSYWESDKALEVYRNSDLFKSLWAKTKTMFNDKPQAWSVSKVVSLDR